MSQSPRSHFVTQRASSYEDRGDDMDEPTPEQQTLTRIEQKLDRLTREHAILWMQVLDLLL